VVVQQQRRVLYVVRVNVQLLKRTTTHISSPQVKLGVAENYISIEQVFTAPQHGRFIPLTTPLVIRSSNGETERPVTIP
jgi:hypothetical protein